MAGFVKLHCSMLTSTTWMDKTLRDLFITALLMATPRELREPTPQLCVDSLDETGWVIPPGWYGFCDTSGDGIIKTADVDPERGYEGLRVLGDKELKSRSQAHEGRRLVRIDGGYIILNYQKYRDRDTTTAERSKRYRENKSRRDVTSDTDRHTVTPRGVTQAEAEAEANPGGAGMRTPAAAPAHAQKEKSQYENIAPVSFESKAEQQPASADTERYSEASHNNMIATSGAPRTSDVSEVQENATKTHVVSRPLTRTERASVSLMSCPASELAVRCRSNPHDASQTNLESRQDVAAVASAWAKAVGLTPRRLGCYSDRNRPLQSILDALAVASFEDVLRACEQAGRDDWCTGRKGTERDPARKRDVGCLSPTVLSRLLAAADEEVERRKRKKATLDKIAAAEAAERERERDIRARQRPRQGPPPPPVPGDLGAIVTGLAKSIDSVRAEPQDPKAKPMTAEEIAKAIGMQP